MIWHRTAIFFCFLACLSALSAARAQGFDVGLFAPPVTLDGAVAPLGSLDGGDINEDGLRDLAALSLELNSVLVYLAAADGTFAPAVQVDIPLQGIVFPMFRLTDANGDGHLDLLAFGMNLNTRVLVVRLGRGDGTFENGLASSVGAAALLLSPNVFDIGDVDGDSTPDFIMLNPGLLVTGGSVEYAPGLGDGTFGNPIKIEQARRPRMVLGHDLDGDGMLDLVFVDSLGAGPQHVVTLRALGGGAFAPTVDNGSMSAGTSDLAVADLDGSGIDDLFVAGGAGGEVFRFMGRKNATFHREESTIDVGQQAADIAIADFDRDGMLDVVATDRQAPAVVAARLLRSNPVGAPAVFATNGIPTALDAGDYDGDGFPDVASVVGNSVQVFFNQLGPFVNLGCGLPCPQGELALSLSGTPSAGHSIGVGLSGLTRPAPGLLFVGSEAVYHPFHGGILVPSPDGALPVASDAALAVPWPHDLAPGTPVYVQAWCAFPGGLAASNTVGILSQ